MIRIPFNEICYMHLPPIPFSTEDIDFMRNIDQTFHDRMIYKTYKYPGANDGVYDSKVTPLDWSREEVDWAGIDNFYDLLPTNIQQVFIDYFTEEFYDMINVPGRMRDIRFYINNPNTAGVHIHKDIYLGPTGQGVPRRVAINIPVSANSLTSDLNFYDDELNLVHSVRYLPCTPCVLNSTVFHEVVHHDKSETRKVININTRVSLADFFELHAQNRVVKSQVAK